MTREQQRQLRELKKALPRILKEEASRYKIKKIDYMLFGVRDDLFFDCMIHVSAIGSTCSCSTFEEIKPLWIDDLHWELLGMESNKKEPLSLRAIGAFALNGPVIYEDRKELRTWSVEELRSVAAEYVEHFRNSIAERTMEDFLNGLKENISRDRTTKALYLLHEKRYGEALALIGGESGCYINGSININDAIRNVCREALGK